MYYVYILYSSKSKNFYYGYTEDLKKRLDEHNKGLSKATAPHKPWKLMFYAAFENKQKAKDFELGTILIDQVMFTYFKEDYEKFRSMTMYPKITWSVGWCANVKPWQLFEHRIAFRRGLRNPEKINKFSEFMNFFVADLKYFFKENKFQKVNWEAVKNAMLNDGDIVTTNYGDGDYGKIFKKILENN